MDYMAQKADEQIEGSISENERLRQCVDELSEALHNMIATFSPFASDDVQVLALNLARKAWRKAEHGP